ncbi:hypothetical protein QE422_003535 [Chryseobacterium sp. SORGH_AS 447]|uniref:hypothetical protein n=1 Tax=Chryseobacterium sp. SORGH_AS_0447 TaxID=3041769 RepID=UPI00277FE040|nr:hypothetical protein [Chryseobacterium sp. SORGH_AS_0447]MDQ1163167.1 hypothetical protein [Chryseobacterium sp. SORGH_AS_0447]
MEIFGIVFQLIFTHLIGNNIYYLVRKLIGDKRSYKEIINSERDSGLRYFTGVFVILAVIILMKKFIK